MGLISIALLTFIASAVGVVTGFGSSTILLPVFLFFLPFQQALLFAAILHLATDIWKVSLFRQGIRWKLIIGLGIAGAFAGVFGAELSFSISETMLTQILGVSLVAYSGFVFLRPNFSLPQSEKVSVAGGAISGFVAGILGIGGAPRSAVLMAYNLPKEVYVATIGAAAIMIDLPRILVYLLDGTRLTVDMMLGMLVYIPMTFLGALVARRLLHLIPQRSFRNFVVTFLFIVGLKLIFF